MSEIILNPDVEILDAKDRELYWLFRQAIDSKFLKAMKTHLDEKEHCYNVCFNQYADMRQLSLKRFVDQNLQVYSNKEIFEQLLESTGEQLIEAITNMIAIYREMERRGIRIK